MTAARLKNTGRFKSTTSLQATEKHITRIADLSELLDTDRRLETPIRPRGADTSATGCNATPAGTVIDLAGLDKILNIDTYNHTVTAQAGVRIYKLVEALAGQGLELTGSFEMTGRTLGGAIAAPCFGPNMTNQSAYLGSAVQNLRFISVTGELMTADGSQKNLMAAMRGSYGLLGPIVDATLKVQPINSFSVSHRRLSLNKFCSVVDTLANSDVGFKFCLMPYKDKVYLDLRRRSQDPGTTHKAPWKLKDWGESTVLPNVFKSLNRVLPFQSVRYQLIDTVSAATQEIVNNRLTNTGSNSTAGQQGRNITSTRDIQSSTWCFPASDFSIVAKAYCDFCRNTYDTTRYRCDMPAIGYRLSKDASSLLSPSFDEPMIALQTASMQKNGWEDFVIDLADFAENWAGLPLFSSTRSFRADYAKQAYGPRLEFFRRIRRQLDPDDRLLSPYMAQYFL